MSKKKPSDDQLVEYLLEAYEDAVSAGTVLDALEDAADEAEEDDDDDDLEEFDGSTDVFVSDIITSFFDDNENVGVLGNYVLVAEIIDDDGKGELVVLTSDNLPTWVSRGMLLMADEHLMDASECE